MTTYIRKERFFDGVFAECHLHQIEDDIVLEGRLIFFEGDDPCVSIAKINPDNPNEREILMLEANGITTTLTEDKKILDRIFDLKIELCLTIHPRDIGYN